MKWGQHGQKVRADKWKKGRGGECRHLESMSVPPSSCHCAIMKAAHVCVVAFILRIKSSVLVWNSFFTFEQIFKKEGERESQGEKMEQRKHKRDREGLEPQALLLLASSQRFFCETRGQANRVSRLLTSASNSTESCNPVLSYTKIQFSKGSFFHRWGYLAFISC